MTAQEFADSLTADQVIRLHEIAYGAIPAYIAEMSDDELLAALDE
jgi:hypothetical protein